jgi:hypothetical protein
MSLFHVMFSGILPNNAGEWVAAIAKFGFFALPVAIVAGIIW